MPLSTSSSERVEGHASAPARSGFGPGQGIIALVAGVVVFFLGLEVSSPLILAHISRTERRVESELKAARNLKPTTPDGRKTVLLVGNSLLLEGVQLDNLHAALAPQCEVSRLGIEQTQYLDWYFGLRRLLQEGARPSIIVLSLASDQFASRLTLDESFAHRQLSTHDFPLAIREIKLDRTTASTYAFAHWSNWLARKGFIRQGVLILLIPKFRALAARITDHGPHIDDPALLISGARARLPELGDLARTYGVTIVLMMPPTLREDQSRQFQMIGATVGVPVWVPSPPGEFPRDLFRDGFHLNDQGAAIFTARLAAQIRDQAATRVTVAPSAEVPAGAIGSRHAGVCDGLQAAPPVVNRGAAVGGDSLCAVDPPVTGTSHSAAVQAVGRGELNTMQSDQRLRKPERPGEQ
jgi:hypothetical protein